MIKINIYYLNKYFLYKTLLKNYIHLIYKANNKFLYICKDYFNSPVPQTLNYICKSALSANGKVPVMP
jgi:hypothetical protein